MGLSLRRIGKSVWETLTPQNEEAQRQANANLQRSNQALQSAISAPQGRGVLARNPQAAQQYFQQSQPVQFSLPRAARSAVADTFTKPSAWTAPKINVGSFRGSGLVEDFINSPFKVGQGIARVGSGDIKGGLGQVATGLIEGPAGLIPIGKVAQAGKGAKLLPKIKVGFKQGAKEGAVYGGAYGAGNAAEQGGSWGDIAKGGAVGALTGGALGGVGGAAFPVAGAVAKTTAKQFQSVPLAPAQRKMRDSLVVGYNRAMDNGRPEIADRFATEIDAIDASTRAPIKKAIDQRIPAVLADFDPKTDPLESLKQEARKYKTSEEWLEAVRQQSEPKRNIREAKVGEVVRIQGPTDGTTWYGQKSSKDFNGSFSGTAEVVKINPKSVTVRKMGGDSEGELYKISDKALASTDAKIYVGDHIESNNLNSKEGFKEFHRRTIQSQPPKSTPTVGKPAQTKPITSSKPQVSLKQPPQLPTTPIVEPKPKVSLKERGFQKNIEKTLPDSPTAAKVVEAMPGYKPITNQKTLAKAASNIGENPQAAYARIATKKQLDSADDVATGNLLLRQAIESGDTEAAIQIGTKLGMDGTKLGQAVQAYATLKRTTPEGIVTYASKQAGKAGKGLDTAVTDELIRRAKEIADMPESVDKARAIRELNGLAEAQGRTSVDVVKEILATPRAAMATADLSAPLRQGAVLGSRFPKEFKQAYGESIKYFGSPGAYEKAMYEISQRPSYPLMKAHKLDIIAAEKLTGTEEQFLSNILESDIAKKAGVGHVVAASSRGYTGFLTKLRADVFDKIVADANEAGVKLDKKALDSLAKFVNSASGRGEGKLTDLASKANVLFSAKLWKSRLDLINPVYYAKLDPLARKYALQSAASFMSVAGTVLGIAAAAGANVERDPRSADWGKIKIGNTRYDILGGHQQNIRALAQGLSGTKIDSLTGEKKEVTLAGALQGLAENKLNPLLGFGWKAAQSKDNEKSDNPLIRTGKYGNQLNLATEAGNMLVPLSLQGVYDTAKDTGSIPKGVAMNVPGTLGVGVQTYGKKDDKKMPATVAKDGTSKEGYSLTQRDDGKYEVTMNGKTKTRDNLKDARALIAKDVFGKEPGSYKVVGDIVYRKNSDGSIGAPISKMSFDYQIGTATLSAQKRAGDFKGWMETAQTQLGRIDEQLKDPSIDPLEAIKLQNQAESLMDSMDKYAGYGGNFTKGRGGSRGGGGSAPNTGSIYKYAISSNAGGAVARPRVSIRSAPKTTVARRSTGKPKVSIRKSRA